MSEQDLPQSNVLSTEKDTLSAALNENNDLNLEELHKKALNALKDLPSDISNKILQHRSDGGRALNAVWKNPNLNSSEKILLLFIGSDLDFRKDFVNQYRYSSLTKIQKATKLDRKTIVKVLKNLIQEKYLSKYEISKAQQIKDNQANYYCLTNRLFDEYVLILADENKMSFLPLVENSITPSGKFHHPLVENSTTPSGKTEHKLPNEFPNENSLMCEQPETHKEKRKSLKDENKIWRDLAGDLKSVVNSKFADFGKIKEIIEALCKNKNIALDEFSPFITDFTNPEYVAFIFKNTRKQTQELDYYGVKMDIDNWISNKEKILNEKLNRKEKQSAAKVNTTRNKTDPLVLQKLRNEYLNGA